MPGLTYGKLRQLRGMPVDDFPQVVAAQKTLADLRDGIAALPFVETEQAGLPATSNYTPTDYLNLHRPSDQARRYFGSRGPGSGYGPGFGCSFGF